jgi:hypothetical protein
VALFALPLVASTKRSEPFTASDDFPVYKNKAAPIPERVADLLARMTLQVDSNAGVLNQQAVYLHLHDPGEGESAGASVDG